MKLYRGTINIGRAPVRHEVKRGYPPMEINARGNQVIVKGAKPRDPLTAPEVLVLRKMFGSDAVTELAEVGEDKALAAQVRNQLETKYGPKAVESVFGIRGTMPLPKALNLDEEPGNEPADDPDDPPDATLNGGAAETVPAARPTLTLNKALAPA